LDGLIVLINEAARNTVPSVQPGIEIDQVLPSAAKQVFLENMRTFPPGEASQFNWNGRDIRVHLKVLRDGDVIRGSLLMLEEG
jgi:hypothetical protein